MSVGEYSRCGLPSPHNTVKYTFWQDHHFLVLFTVETDAGRGVSTHRTFEEWFRWFGTCKQTQVHIKRTAKNVSQPYCLHIELRLVQNI